MKSAEWAYFAGLFDGEGTVTMTSVKAGDLRLSICNNNPSPLLELEKKFGGRVCIQRGKNRDSYRWIVKGDKSVEFAQSVLPFLRIKRGQVECYLALRALTRRSSLGRGHVLTCDELAERRALIQQAHTTRKAEGGR